jgi:hypothetical protein
MKDAFTALPLTLLVGPTFADPWKDESGMLLIRQHMNARPDIDQTPDDGADHLGFPRQARQQVD